MESRIPETGTYGSGESSWKPTIGNMPPKLVWGIPRLYHRRNRKNGSDAASAELDGNVELAIKHIAMQRRDNSNQ
jgi:hypothetical protein